MVLKIDFNSDEVIYIQLRNRIIMGTATDMAQGENSLPSVRQTTGYTSTNMHTVNRVYAVLKQEGSVKLDRRRGAVVSLDIDRIQAIGEIRKSPDVVLAWGIRRNMTGQEVHQLVDETSDKYTRGCMEGEDEVEEN